MNFSKGFLLLFQLLSFVFQIYLISSMPTLQVEVSSVKITQYNVLIGVTIITYLFSLYAIYHLSTKEKEEEIEPKYV
jgi:uncharacterized membrane protein